MSGEPGSPHPSPGTDPDIFFTRDPNPLSGQSTEQAPPYRAPVPVPGRTIPSRLEGLPRVGETIGEFELIHELGTGAFARVFLARQSSLGRLVALKVSRNRSEEGRTLASLEHDHIVHVFTELVHGDLRLLCMQYVPGTTLERVIRHLASLPPARRTGQSFLDAVDSLRHTPAALDLAGLRTRELLAGLDAIETACWVMARLAEALAHAHGLGVLHRDIKPANVLVNSYGRPLLADFNVASSVPSSEREDSGVGGTVAYMAPEHLDAFNPGDPTPASAVDVRSDVYSLGVLLFELLTGRLPFPYTLRRGALVESLAEHASLRRGGPPPLPADIDAPPAVVRVLIRCLAPNPVERFASAADLAAALEGCRAARCSDRSLPPAGRITRLALRAPLLVATLLALVPHFLGSLVNVAFNAVWIVDHLTPAQKDQFIRLVLGYNVVVYPLCLWILVRQAWPVFRAYHRMAAGSIEPSEVNRARRRALTLPLWASGVACLGWLPGGLLFPLALDWLAGPIMRSIYLWFIASFTVSGLIALTYSVFGVQFVVLRILYPRLWVEVRDRRQVAARELAPVEGRIARLQFLAVLIPLAGAALLLGSGEETGGFGISLTFRVLVTALMGLGTLGLGVALVVSARLRRTIAALVGG
jgi:eukaryotic-like serine/threonine-protein kinase